MNRLNTIQQELLRTEEYVTSSPEAWQDFLNTAARMYKYSWPDQLNIFAQRPEATAVADMETWNKRIGRMVKRGSAAIFLRNSKTGGVRYVFDYADTEPYRRKSNLPGDIRLWTLGEHGEAVQAGLSRTYGEAEGLQEQIFQAALTEVGGFYEANQQRIDQELSLCAIAETTDLPQRATLFLRLATMSAAYAVSVRCGISMESEYRQFQDIVLLDQLPAVEALGFAVQRSSGTILRQMERTIRTEERKQQKEAEQDETGLQGEGRVSVSRRERGRGRGEQVPGQIRLDAQPVSEGDGPPAGAPDVSGRDPVSPSAPDAGAGQRESGADGSEHGGEGDSARPADPALSVGTGDGHAEGTGGGSGDPGADLHRLTEEAEQPEPVDRLWLLEEALTGEYGLLELSDIDNISRQFDGGKSTGDVAQRLALTYEGQRRDATAYDQLPISYEAKKEIFLYSYGKEQFGVIWSDVASLLHTLYREGQRGFEAHPEAEQPFLSSYYVIADLSNYDQQGSGNAEFATLDEAIDAYRALPEDAEKSLGVFRSTDGEPLDLLERIHGQDILYRDYLLLEGWNHPEMQEAAVTLFQQFPQKGIRQLSRYQYLRGQGPDYPEGTGAYSLQRIVTDLPERLDMNTVRKLVRDGGSTADLYLAYWLSTALEGQEYTIEGAVYADARPEGYCIHITGEERYAVVYGWNEIAKALMEQVQDAIRTEIALSSYLPDIAGYLADEPTGEYVTMLTGDNTVITYLQRSDGVDVWFGDAPKGDPQLSVTMAELSESVEAAKQAAQTIPADPVLDALLRTGGNRRNGVLRIIAFHQLQGGDFASFLREEFCDDGMKVGGKGLILDGTKYAAWYDIEGIHISAGNTIHSGSAYLVTWEQAANRVAAMLAQGVYQPQSVVEQAISHERLECAEGLWNLRHDYNSQQERPFFMRETLFQGLGFPEATAGIADRLADPDFLRQTLDGLNEFRLAYTEDKSILRFHYHQPLFLLGRMTKLLHEPLAYPVSTYEDAAPDAFITEDEIDDVIHGRDNLPLVYYSFFIHNHTPKEQEDFLKETFGTSGHSHGVSRADDSFVDYSGKGATFRRGEVEVRLNWSQYARRLREMVLSGHFLTQNDIEKVPDYEFEQLVRRVTTFFQILGWENLPNDPGGDYYRRKDAIAGMIATETGLNQLHSAMTQTFSVMENENPNWERLFGYFHDLTDWQNDGTLFLFVPSPEVQELAEKRGVTLYSYPEGHREGSQLTIQETEPTSETNPEPETDQPFPYQVGDTVYLEDGKPFTIEQIGLYDVQLRDPAQTYPIFRAESRENLLWLVERYPQQPPEYTTKTVTVYPGAENHLPYDVVIQAIGAPEIQPVPEQAPPPQNYRITDEHLGEGGPKEKFWRNTKAIAALKQIEGEGRQATAEEQHILSQYVGWGGLPDAFDSDKPAWAAEYSELKGLLTDREYAAARASVLNAHFTSPTVIHAVYDAVARMGFQSGRILEPSMGVGNFFGLLPDSMAQSQLYGVELDSITGRIAQQLYPKANITVAGFETTRRKDFFDLAVGNVPFGQYQVNDPAFNRLGFSIHNYFFAKALEQVRPGGIVAFLTSRYTMDAQNTSARRYIAQRAELLGAIRLPNNAFRANAGTDVVSDILFLQKRERPVEIEPEWVSLGESENGFAINQYFVDHPEMVLGTATSESTQYGRQDYTVIPMEGADLSDLLRGAVEQLPVGVFEAGAPTQEAELDDLEGILPPPDLPAQSFVVVNDTLYYKDGMGERMQPYQCSDRDRQRIMGLVELRDVVRELIQCQLDGGSDGQVEVLQGELNLRYDRFVAKWGYLNSRANQRAFQDDASIYLLSSLEFVDGSGNVTGKTDFFTKRTIRHIAPVTHCDTAQEALAVCLGERGEVNIARIADLTGQTEEQVIADLQGLIYADPAEHRYVTADEYLSGNVRLKLEQAKAAAKADPDYSENVTALEQVQPNELGADEIDVRLGSTWIQTEYVEAFVQKLLRLGWWQSRNLKVLYVPEVGEWHIEGKSDIKGLIQCRETYGTPRMQAPEIIERTLNLKDVRVYDQIETENGPRRVLNLDETVAARSKQELIQQAFKDWIFEDPDRRAALVAEYNRRFNSYRNRSYDGSNLTFSGMSPEIALRAHQINAVARGLYGGNTLLAHVVGAGKTWEITAIAMESKRLGMAHKSMIVVPNHLTGQWGIEFLRLYPAAKVLVATEKDFSTKNRKRFCTRIATGDWDAVIIGHSQFERIPLSVERQEAFLQEQIDSITEGIDAMKHQNGERWSIKAMERTRKGLQARMEKLQDSAKDENVISFEALGVDRLFVDEAQAYKNGFIYTKMQNVAGISQSESQRAFDLFQKCRYLDAETGGRGVIFATGTPISNSMVEMFIMQRYLQFDRLEEAGLGFFDAWASTFGEVTTTMELATEGTGYRSRTRFAKFHNLPELMSMFQEVADIKTADELKLDVPTAHYETIVAQRTEIQAELVQELSERATKVHNKQVSPEVDNMLRITTDGRKVGLDQRLINPDFPDEPGSKVNLAVENVLHIWQDSAGDRGTQLVFVDFSTPTDPKKFNVYSDMKAKLIAAGVPEGEIAFIHDAKTKAAKSELFQRVREGDVRILFGSTEKMGAGTNVQTRLRAIHDVDCPWRPGDLEQRAGRIVRQGNQNKDVYIYRYVTDSTFDSYLYQTVENKQRFISQVMTSKTPVRSCEDVDESVLSYAEIKALCAGDPLIKEKMELDTELTRLKVLRSGYKRQQYRLEDMIRTTLPNSIRETEVHLTRVRQDESSLNQVLSTLEQDAFLPLKVDGVVCETRADAGKALADFMATIHSTEPVKLGTWFGFSIQIYKNSLFNDAFFQATIQGAASYSVGLGDSGLGNIVRIENAIKRIPESVEQTEKRLESLQTQLTEAQEELGKPWPMEAEFQAKTARLAELDARLTLEENTAAPPQEPEVSEEKAPPLRTFAERLGAAATTSALFQQARTQQERQGVVPALGSR